jgi:O-antigen ligase
LEGRAESLHYVPGGNGSSNGRERVPVPRIAADAMIAAGAVLLAATLPLIALRFLSLKPGLFPFIVAGTAAGIFLLRRPEWIVPCYMAVAWTSIEAAYFGGLPSPIEVGGMVLLGYATWEATRRTAFAREVLVICSLLALPALIAGLESPAGTSIPVPALKNLTFLFLVALSIRRVSDVERAAVTLSATGIFLGIGSLFSVFVHPTRLFPLKAPDIPFQVIAPRAAGPIGDPNFFALVMAALVPFALYLVARGGKRYSLLGLVSVLCLIGGVFATGSRGGLIAIAVAIVGTGFALPSRRLRIAATSVVVATLLFGLPLFAVQRHDASARSDKGRLSENLVAMAMFVDHPITGVGPKQYPNYYRDYTRDIGTDPRQVREAHSLPLQIAAEQGIAGIIGWLVGLLTILRFAIARGVWDVMIGRTVMVSVGAFLTGSLFLHGDTIRLLYILLGLLLALGYAVSREREELHG